MISPVVLCFRRGKQGDLIARAEDGKIVLPARGLSPEEGTSYLATLVPAQSGRAYIATRLVPGKISGGLYGLPPHPHPFDVCPICEAEWRRLAAQPCPGCGSPIGDPALRRCERCTRAMVQRAREEAIPRLKAWRAEILARPLPDDPGPAPEPGRRISPWVFCGEEDRGTYVSPDEMGTRRYVARLWKATWSCGHDETVYETDSPDWTPDTDECAVCRRASRPQREAHIRAERARKLRDFLAGLTEERIRQRVKRYGCTDPADLAAAVIQGIEWEAACQQLPEEEE
jgi:hypothetical protein